MENTTSDNGKIVAIISYFFVLGWIIALVLNNGNKTVLGSFHVRQSLGIMCIGVILSLIVGIFDIFIITLIIILALIVFWLLGLISAISGEMKPVPVFGRKFQEWFKGI